MMSQNVSSAFEYQVRTSCVCGASISESSSVRKKKFAWGDVSFVRCESCCSWIQSPQLTLDSVAEWYDSVEYREGGSKKGGYLDYFADEPQRRVEAEARYRLDLDDCLPTSSKVLEVGCATGTLVSILNSHGHDAMGIDLSHVFVQFATETNGVKVLLEDYLEFKAESSSFDAVVMLGTVSNMHNLPLVFEKTRTLLKPGGCLYINFPDAASMPARLYRSNYWMYAPSVINFMSFSGCAVALRNAGFKVRWSKRDRQRPSMSKLLSHSKMSCLYEFLKAIGLGGMVFPVSLPIPGVKVVMALKN